MDHSILITHSKPKTPVELLLPYGQMTGHRGTGSQEFQDFADFVDPSRLPTQSEISFLPAAMNQQPNQVNHPKRLLLRDVVTFLSVEGPNKWALGQTWGGPTISLLYINPNPAQNVGGPGPTRPLR